MLGKNGLATLAMAILAVSVVGRAEDARRDAKDSGQKAAEQENRSTTRNQTTRRQRPLDHHVAQCLILGNQEEIVLLRFGAEKTQNQNVRQLAEKMIRDHEQFIEKLSKHSPGAKIELKPGPTDQATRTTDAKDSNGVEVRVGEKANDGNIVQVRGTKNTEANSDANNLREDRLMDRLFAIEYRAAQECLALSKQCLEKEQGENFDKAFLGQQIGMHIGMLAKLKASRNEVSENLQQLISKGIETTKSHKDQVEKLMAEIHGNNTSSDKSQSDARSDNKAGATTKTTTKVKKTVTTDE